MYSVNRCVLLTNASQVGGNPGLATLVMAVGVGLLIQYWEKGLYTLGLMLEALGVGADSAQPPAPTTQRERASVEGVARFFWRWSCCWHS